MSNKTKLLNNNIDNDLKIINNKIELWNDLDDFINNDIELPISTLWTEKYRPTSLNDYFISKEQLKIVDTWLKNFLKGKLENYQPFLVLYGMPGVGKTTLAYLLMKKYNLEIIEINASDVRNKKQVKELIGKIGPYSVSNLTKSKKIIGLIMDEIDGMLGGDHGGINELINILIPQSIQNASNLKSNKVKKYIRYKFPVIATCNSIKDSKLQYILKYSLVLKINPPNYKYLKSIIERISLNENFNITDDKCQQLINNNSNDYRQLINNLYQYYIQDKNKTNQILDNNTYLNSNTYLDIDDIDNKIKIYGDTVIERIQQILIHPEFYKLNKEFKFTDSNLYCMCLYNNIIPVLGKYQYLTKRIKKEEYLLDLKEIIELYKNINLVNTINEKIHNIQNWEINQYIEYIGINNVLNIFFNKNKKLFDWNILTHHHNYNIMRQEQSNHRKLFNSYENNNFITNPIKLYYQNKLENNIWNKKISFKDINNKKKINPYEKILEKIDNILQSNIS